MTGRSHYEVLGVPRGASARDIRRAYRALALRYHPDVYSGPEAGSRFREIADAYEVLNDPVQRASYDAMAPAAQGRNDRAAVSGVRRRARDVPRFVDDRPEVRLVVGDVIGALLRELLADGSAVGWAPGRDRGGPSLSRQSRRTEVWRWR
jgi:DnaJ-class molecular chaperone